MTPGTRLLAERSVQHRGHCRCRLRSDALEHVTVPVHRERDRGVAETLGVQKRLFPCLYQVDDVGVPQIVETGTGSLQNSSLQELEAVAALMWGSR